MKIFIWIFCFISLICFSKDSGEIHYSIVGMNFYYDYDVIKIMVPNWLSKDDLIEQTKRVLIWPDEPPPHKKTYVYIFKETDQIADYSNTYATYIPNKGFLWNLENWEPTIFKDEIPTERELIIYSALMDSIFKNGSTLDNIEVRKKISNSFNISVPRLDSIYTKVKYWLYKNPQN